MAACRLPEQRVTEAELVLSETFQHHFISNHVHVLFWLCKIKWRDKGQLVLWHLIFGVGVLCHLDWEHETLDVESLGLTSVGWVTGSDAVCQHAWLPQISGFPKLRDLSAARLLKQSKCWLPGFKSRKIWDKDLLWEQAFNSGNWACFVGSKAIKCFLDFGTKTPKCPFFNKLVMFSSFPLCSERFEERILS